MKAPCSYLALLVVTCRTLDGAKKGVASGARKPFTATSKLTSFPPSRKVTLSRRCASLPDDSLDHPLRSSESNGQLPDAGPLLSSFHSDLIQVRLRKLPERRPSNVLALSTRFIHPHRNAAPNEVMFELGDRANNMK